MTTNTAIVTIEARITLVPTRRQRLTAEIFSYLAALIRLASICGPRISQAHLATRFHTTRLFVWEVLSYARFTETPNPKYPYSRPGY